jgi:hypothetical protein
LKNNSLHELENTKASGSIYIKKGSYQIIWTGDKLSSYRATQLEYTIEHKPDHVPSPGDSGIDIKTVDDSSLNTIVEDGDDEDIFYDALQEFAPQEIRCKYCHCLKG